MGTLGYSDASQRAMLDEVLRREREFHDAWAKVIDRDGIHVPDYFEACTAPENRFILRHLGDIRGKYILDLGCGAGENSVYFALRGAQCVAGDYSPEMVHLAQALAAKYGVSITGKVMNAMAIDAPDETFDVVYAANLPKNVGLKPRPNASGTATPRGRLYAILKIEARVVNLSKNPVA